MKTRILIFVVIGCLLPKYWTFGQLLVNNGVAVTVGNTSTVTVNGDVLNQLDGTFVVDGEVEFTGDLTNNSSSTMNSGTGTYEAKGSALQVLTGSSEIDFYNFTLNNTSTGAQLGTNINVSNNMQMTDGDLHLNGDTVDLSTTGQLSGETNDNRIYGLTGALTATRTLNAPAAVNVAGTGCELTSAANLGVTEIIRRHNTYVTQGGVSIFRNFSIEPANNSGLNATLHFHYFEKELNGLYESDLQAYKSIDGGASWDFMQGTMDTVNNYCEKTAIDDFSLWTLAFSVILPIQWIDFRAEISHQNEVMLEWLVGAEQSGTNFILEQSYDGLHYEGLGVVKGVGSPNEISLYHQLAVQEENIAYYRIRKVDNEGNEGYSEIRMVALMNDELHVYPTIVHSNDPIIISGGDEQYCQFVLFDQNGREIINREIQLNGQDHEIGHEDLLPGTYHYKLMGSNMSFKTGKISIVR